MKDNLENGRKELQMMQLTGVNIQNKQTKNKNKYKKKKKPSPKKKKKKKKPRQKKKKIAEDKIDMYPKKTQRWPTGTLNDGQHH